MLKNNPYSFHYILREDAVLNKMVNPIFQVVLGLLPISLYGRRFIYHLYRKIAEELKEEVKKNEYI